MHTRSMTIVNNEEGLSIAVCRTFRFFVLETPTMICRIWHGWTTHANADAYQSLLLSEIFPGIQNRHIAGYRSIQLLRHDHADEVEFVTVMWFDSLDAIRAFA